SDQARQVNEAAREVGRDLDAVEASLRATARLLRTPVSAADPTRELRALRAAVEQDRLIRVTGAAGPDAGGRTIEVGSLGSEGAADDAGGSPRPTGRPGRLGAVDEAGRGRAG